MLNFKIFVFLLVVYSNIPANSSLIDTAAFIANAAYKHQHVTTLVWWYADIEHVTEFLNYFHGSLAIAPIENNNNITARNFKAVGFKQTVFLADTTEEFAYFATLVKLDLITPMRLILVLTQVQNLSDITRIAWNNDIADIIIVTENNDGDTELYTYFPYNQEICVDLSPVKLSIDSDNYFAKKFTNFHRCPIRATLLQFLPYVKFEKDNDTITSITGIDGSVFSLVIETLNASLDVYSSTDHGGMGSYINGSGTGSFGDLVNRYADIFAPAAVISSQRYSAAQVSHVYETLDVYWCAPNPREIYAWAKVLLPFFSSITPFIALTFAIFVVTISLFKRTSFHRTVTKDSAFFLAFIIFLGQDAKFETKSRTINSLFMLWIWFCLIVRIGYQGDLVDGLQKKILEPHLGSLEEAIKALDGYGGVEVFREFYRGTSIEKNYKVLPLIDIPPYINDVSEGKRFLLATDILLVRQFRRIVQVLDEPVRRAATCLFMRPGWPAGKEVDHLIQKIIEAGLTQKILDDYRYEWMLTVESNSNDSREAKSLNMSTLSACFYGLIALWVICFLVLIIEVIYYRLKMKQTTFDK